MRKWLAVFFIFKLSTGQFVGVSGVSGSALGLSAAYTAVRVSADPTPNEQLMNFVRDHFADISYDSSTAKINYFGPKVTVQQTTQAAAYQAQ